MGDLVSGQPGARAADRHRRDLPLGRDHRRAADAARRALGDCATDRRGGRRRRAALAATDARSVGNRRLRTARRVGGSLPRGRRLRARRLPRPARAGRPPRSRASSDGDRRHARRRSAATIVCCVTPGAEIVVGRADLHAGPAPEHARRGRPRQGRGDVRRRRLVRAVLRRVGAGVARRRAHRRRHRRPGRPASRSPSSARCSPATPPGGRRARAGHAVRLDRPRDPGPRVAAAALEAWRARPVTAQTVEL